MNKKIDRSKGKGGRGSGRRMFIANEEELEIRNLKISEESHQRKQRREDGEEGGDDAGEEEDEEEEEEEEEEEVKKKPVSVFGFQGEVGEGIQRAANPNKQKPVNVDKGIKLKDLNNMEAGGSSTNEVQLSRREREELEAIRKKEEYERRHRAGETVEAKKDLERLAEVKRRREEAAKKRELEGRAPGWSADGIPSSDSDSDSSDDGKPKLPKQLTAAAVAATKSVEISEAAAKKKEKALAEVSDVDSSNPDSIPKLKAMDIKKLNGDALKDALKVRKLDVQGQKKDLIKRLCDYEAARG